MFNAFQAIENPDYVEDNFEDEEFDDGFLFNDDNFDDEDIPDYEGLYDDESGCIEYINKMNLADFDYRNVEDVDTNFHKIINDFLNSLPENDEDLGHQDEQDTIYHKFILLKDFKEIMSEKQIIRNKVDLIHELQDLIYSKLRVKIIDEIAFHPKHLMVQLEQHGESAFELLGY